MADLTIGTAPRRRGRPKGTGIDDTMLLRQIVGLMAGDPALKPTTAIKQVGIDNPSIVRRLREKLKLAQIDTPPQPPVRARKQQKPRGETVAPPHQPRSAARNQGTGSQRVTHAPAPTTSAHPEPSGPVASPQDTQARDITKAREAALLAAYLKALQATAVPSLDDEQQTGRIPTPAPRPVIPPEPPPRLAEPAGPPSQHSNATRQAPQPPPNPFAAFAQPTSPPAGMMFPFMPPFLQPFAPKPPPAHPLVQNQMEALKASVEVMTAMAKLQMLTYQNALAGTPFGNMLQAQTMMGQMLLASFAGVMGGKKPPDKA